MRLPRLRWSKQNGLIYVSGGGEVWAYGVKQTSARYAQLWSDALEGAALPSGPKQILMLGLAGGGALLAIEQVHPGSKVAVIEYDKAMITIGQKLLQGMSLPTPKIIAGDAPEVLRGLLGTFDLILVDIFIGAKPAPAVYTASFWASIREHLRATGAVVLNVASSGTSLPPIENIFSKIVWRQIRENTFALLYV